MLKNLILVLSISFLLFGCWYDELKERADRAPVLQDEKDSLGEINIHVDHFKQANNSVLGAPDCFRITEFFDGWEYYCNEILEFKYEWGYEYELKVNAYNVSSYPYFAFNRQLFFKEVINKQRVPVGTPFEYHIVNQDISKDNSTGIYHLDIKYRHSFKYVCEEEDCLYIESQNKNKIGMVIEFLHPETTLEPFIFNQIKCISPIETFEESCNSF